MLKAVDYTGKWNKKHKYQSRYKIVYVSIEYLFLPVPFPFYLMKWICKVQRETICLSQIGE